MAAPLGHDAPHPVELASRRLLRDAVMRLEQRAEHARALAELFRAELLTGNPRPEVVALASTQLEELNHATTFEPRTNSTRRGEKHHSAKLTDAQVAEIRATYRRGRHGEARDFALRYGVSRQLIHMIVVRGHRADSLPAAASDHTPSPKGRTA